MTLDWQLFIYSVPSQPSRKRAYVWRELKRLGAVYLRDGVALLPRRADLEERLQAMAERVEAFEGEADLILSPRFASPREQQLVERFQEERAAEYRELHHACVRFLRDVLEEVDAEDFGFPDVDKLESELGRLKRWGEQIQARDYFAAPGRRRVRDALDKCERAFEAFASKASEHAGAMPAASSGARQEDVFERLGGSESPAPVPDDYPL